MPADREIPAVEICLFKINVLVENKIFFGEDLPQDIVSHLDNSLRLEGFTQAT